MALTSDIQDANALRRLAERAHVFTATPAANWSVREFELPQRVIFVNRYFFPDVSATSQILTDLARQLVMQGIEVHVICAAMLYDDPKAQLPSEEVVHGVHVHRAATTRFGRGSLAGRSVDYASFYASGARRLLSLLRAGDVVVAKTDPPLISIAVAAIARLRGAHLINWLQDVFPEVASHLGANPLPAWLDRALKRLRDRSLSAAEVNIVLGTRMREHLERRHVPPERIKIIENWADADVVVPTESAASELRRAHGLMGKFVIGYSGNLGRAHEFETLFAAAELLDDRTDLVFLMVGGGAKMEQLRAKVGERGLRNFVFLPYQPRERLSDSLAAADVHLACLLPELEGLIVPSKCYGVMAAARPLIFIGDTDGEVARILERQQCGLAVRTGDSVHLARSILDLRRDATVRRAMGERARELFLTSYTLERATGEWVNVLGSLQPVRRQARNGRAAKLRQQTAS